jgi:hypothetical protein
VYKGFIATVFGRPDDQGIVRTSRSLDRKTIRRTTEMRTHFVSSLLLAAAGVLLCSPGFAQVYGPSGGGERAPNDVKASAAAPKPAYDPHDLSGVWWGVRKDPLMGNPSGPLTPAGQKMFDANKPSFGPRGVPPAQGNDPIGNCDPPGYPRNIYFAGRPFSLIQTPTEIVQIFEWTRGMREIWMDGRKLPADVDPRYYGYAVGHWDGNSLMVDSTAYNEETWLDMAGDPHSEDMTIHEVFTHPDAMTLNLSMTINDPKIYAKPLVSKTPMVFQLQLPKGVVELREEYCVPSQEQSFNANDRDPAGGRQAQK